jgi:hypothetical protein
MLIMAQQQNIPEKVDPGGLTIIITAIVSWISITTY